MPAFDVTALGEILIDFTSCGKSENGAALFEQNPGGAPANVLCAVAKLGGKAAFLGKVGDDMHGAFLRTVLEQNGVCTDGLRTDPRYFTTLAFVQLSQGGKRTFSFARKPGADTQLTPEEVRCDLIKNSRIFHVGSLSLTDEPSRAATMRALEYARANGITVSYDPNYRAMLWKDEPTAMQAMRSVLPYAGIIKISEEELPLLTGLHDPEQASAALLAAGVSCVLVTLGGKGALVRTRDGCIRSACPNVRVVDTTGAGDSFMGGFLYSLCAHNQTPADLTLADAQAYADFSNLVATLCVTKRGAISAMPSMQEVLQLQQTL